MNSELMAYFNTLCDGKYPKFIDKYLETDEFKRLDRIGMFCGCDYTRLFQPMYWYSRLDHSISTALMTYNFTKDKEQTILALFHDLGTPAFSHCVDFLLGDAKNQLKSEKSVKDVVASSQTLMDLLKKDKIDFSIFDAYENYPIVECEKPKLCVDRLDGILAVNVILLGKYSVNQMAEMYKKLTVLKNEYNEEEIGCIDTESGEMLFDYTSRYSILMQGDEDKFVMQFIADNINLLIKRGKLVFEDLYLLGEQEILNILKKENGDNLKTFNMATKIKRSEVADPRWYSVSVDAKKRYVLPLVKLPDKRTVRLHTISQKCKSSFEYILKYQDSKFAYMPNIKYFY